MAIRRPLADVAKKGEKKVYFSTEWGFKKKTNFGLGVDAYVIMLGLDEGIYETPVHKVKARRKPDKTSIGFKSFYDTYIVCKGVDANGEKLEGATCCALAQHEKDRLPEKDDSDKRMLGFSTTLIHIPVLILGNCETDPKVKKIPPSKLSLNPWDFTYLEFTSYQFNNLLEKLKEDLINNGDIDVDLTGEELYTELVNQLGQTILKVSGVTSKSPQIKYERSYSFVRFDNQAVGKLSGEHDSIVNYKQNKELRNAITTFMTLFNTEIDNLVVNKWADEELEKYVIQDTKRIEDVNQVVNDLAKDEQVVEVMEDETVEDVQESFSDKEIEALVDESDFSLDIDDEDMFSDDDDMFSEED